MEMDQRQKTFDLGERTYRFARDVRRLVKQLARTVANQEDGRQLVRSSGSVGANYIEANEALGDKDFSCRMKVSRKEAKESHYWLRLLDLDERSHLEANRTALMQEADELVRIFSAIVRNHSQRD